MAILQNIVARNLRELLAAREGLDDGWIVRCGGVFLSFADGTPRACRVDQASRFTRAEAEARAAGMGEAVQAREAIEAATNRLEKFLATGREAHEREELI